MWRDKIINAKVLCGTDPYEQRYYFNQDFSPLPQSIQDELHIMCILYIEDVGGILTMEFDNSGGLEFKVMAPKEDCLLGKIGSVLKIEQHQEEKKELSKTLELYYRTSFPGEEIAPGEDEEEQMKLRIGNTLFGNNVMLVPMAGVTDLPFCLLCRERRAGCVVTGMVNAKTILYNNRNTRELLQIHPQERPAAAQLSGSGPEIMGEIAVRIKGGSRDFIDVNMGCPVPKIVSNGKGSALIKDPKKVGEIPTAMVRAIKKPVTVKFWKGFSDSRANRVEFTGMAESCGMVTVTIHGRIKEQYCSDRTDWDIIRWVKEAVKVPIIGNGDIFTSRDAKYMMEETGCDGLMMVRGAKGNPWIFRRINYHLDTGEFLPKPSIEEMREMVLRHGRMLVEYKGEPTAMREIRGYMTWYTKRMPHSAVLRNEINQVETLEGLAELLNRRVPADTGGKDGNHS